MKKIFSFVVASLMATTMWAAVGPQSVLFTFSDTEAEGWTVTNNGSTAVSDGVLTVTMGVQNADQNKYRADLQYKVKDRTMNKVQDNVWAIKLTAAFLGNLTFEAQRDNGSNNPYFKGQNVKSTLTCEDGGVIYYVDATSQLDTIADGNQTLLLIQFKMADAVFDNAEDAKYSVDWIGSFATLNDLKSFANWNDDQLLGTEAYFELLFRPKADGSGYDSGTPKTSFEMANTEFEGNYQAGLFAVEYFLVENFDAEKNYELVLASTGSNTSDLAVWDFPYQVNSSELAADIITKATAVVGVAPRAAEGDIKAPVASAKHADGEWKFAVAGSKLTVLATQGTHSLVGLLVTSAQATTANQKGKFASCANAAKARPTLAEVKSDPTAIDQTAVELKAEKLIINGQIVIRRGDHFFDLTGREL